MNSYKPYWPETTIFWGAGATASLGIPATEKQGLYIFLLADDRKKALKERLKDVPFFIDYVDEINDLLVDLGDNLESRLDDFDREQEEAAARLFPTLSLKESKKWVVHLRQTYDWDALKRIIQICPSEDGSNPFLVDLFNILDMHILSGQGFYTKNGGGKKGEPYFVANYRLRPAKNCLIMLINLQIFCTYQSTIEKSPEKIDPYILFAKALAELMQEEGIASGLKDYADREFYLFSYSVVSMNFDPLLLWFIFNAHKEANDNPPHIGIPAQPMKLFHDFGHFMGVRRVGPGFDPGVWYPFNETVAQRINDSDHVCGRIGRLGKFYFPHGCCCWRECANCGKLTVHFGDEWDYRSSSLFPSPVIPALKKNRYRSAEEQRAEEKGIPDGVQCAYCGTITLAADTPMIMQSNYKGSHPPYIEEIHRDLKVCLENANHIVLLGYSLPKDDVVWRSVLATRKSREQNVHCSVVVGFKGDDEWLEGAKLEAYVADIKKNKHPCEWDSYGISVIDAAIEIFDRPNVRAYTHGIPEVWINGSDVAEQTKKLLNWRTNM